MIFGQARSARRRRLMTHTQVFHPVNRATLTTNNVRGFSRNEV